ncbi:hypothetical protein HJG53_00815 [Sphingomonas sp. ID1715]|uniref:hypothetical protein n=1 Tax=Sphingomonas sp. ID1715 TaxID=1656898 RepID=UPI00148A00A8|nr:hypothetical protein [Sphingomonas sp. ID1715]NNM75451.1 hypothetical protein [Sphingomonas sp. ID1715]
MRSVANDDKTIAPAAGRFGIARADVMELRIYRPAGCPSAEQFAARFHVANDPGRRPSVA